MDVTSLKSKLDVEVAHVPARVVRATADEGLTSLAVPTPDPGARSAVGTDVFVSDAMHNGKNKDFRRGGPATMQASKAELLGENALTIDDTTLSSLTNATFEPLDDRVLKAYLGLGLRTADWTARLSALIMTWLFIMAPPFTTWMRCNQSVEAVEMLARSIASPFLAIAFDAVGFCVEVNIGGYDYGLGLAEYADYGLTLKSFCYAALNTVSVLGMFIMSDAGPFLLGKVASPDCYCIGRST
ncbi:hypothetical protein HK101_010535 [Irineochytrium annulatum]|nr:hypothetical protein HK101_010535 [Irineochytrium annulatum]